MFSRELYIFAGPSLPEGIGRGRRTTVLPPIVDGDLRRLISDQAAGAHIHIVDGVFGAAQAITVTEIGEAIRAGFTLSGSTSMGALRAVEAAPLGMRGYGRIFREYLSGERTQDADVALLHDMDGRPLTVPKVGLAALRRTLEMTPGSKGARAIELLESLHYTERTEARVSAEMENVGICLAAASEPRSDQANMRVMHDEKVNDARLALEELFCWDASPTPIRTRGIGFSPSPGDFECLLTV